MLAMQSDVAHMLLERCKRHASEVANAVDLAMSSNRDEAEGLMRMEAQIKSLAGLYLASQADLQTRGFVIDQQAELLRKMSEELGDLKVYSKGMERELAESERGRKVLEGIVRTVCTVYDLPYPL